MNDTKTTNNAVNDAKMNDTTTTKTGIKEAMMNMNNSATAKCEHEDKKQATTTTEYDGDSDNSANVIECRISEQSVIGRQHLGTLV